MNKSSLTITDSNALAHHNKLHAYIQQAVQQAGGKISFADFMQLALYAPGLGYYTAGAHKIGKEGDFVTAPEISNLFSRTLAKQCAEILPQLNQQQILEFGAGTGKMAAAILNELALQNCLPTHYYILEVSADLRERQKKNLSAWLDRVIWLDALPEKFSGIILANEILDAMPVDLFNYDGETLQEAFVTIKNNEFILDWSTASAKLLRAFNTIKNLSTHWQLPYQSEINSLLPAWIKSLAQCLHEGVILLIDYGFPRHEYYHPQRKTGTLMCHYQQQAHTDPLILCGLQDITAHVDFTAVIEHADAAGLTLEGFTTQAQFLLNLGIEKLLAEIKNEKELWQAKQQLKLLTLPHEMGEIFKVMGLSKNYAGFLTGFAQGDVSHRL